MPLDCDEKFHPESANGSEIDVQVPNSFNEGTSSQEIDIAEEASVYINLRANMYSHI